MFVCGLQGIHVTRLGNLNLSSIQQYFAQEHSYWILFNILFLGAEILYESLCP